ncbi:MAG TPA: dihydroorotate dehydrogenase electron transfer subunit [Gemmatimonadota bacterium]|nr:dihydroorotate dehydrogenase electron transfer subunit [Gemmatimonadota bacterium]
MTPGSTWTIPLGEVEVVAEGTYWLRFQRPDGLACEPGHFFMLSPAFPGGVPFLGRPLSIGDVDGGRLHFLLRALGRATRWFRGLPPGSPMRLVGPLGRPFDPPDREVHRLVAGGIGLAPFFYLARRLRESRPGARIELLYGERAAAAHVELDGAGGLFDAVERYTDDGSRGARGTVVDGAAAWLDGPPAAWYGCGPHPMLRALAGRLEEAGVTGAQFSLEERMACGFGVCQACIVPNRSGSPRYRLLCVEGPVVDPREVAW